jgi:hypothetical protein
MTRFPTGKIRCITTARMTRLYFVLAIALGAQLHAVGQEPGNKGHFYDGMAAMKYGRQFLGFLTVHPRHAGDAGHIGLASSSDGLTWYQPLSRQPFIGPSDDGNWDAGHTWLSNDAIQVGQWSYIYYVGSSRS